MSWKHLYLGKESNSVIVGGVDVWSKPWRTQGEEAVAIKHPVYPGQECRLTRYFIESAGKAYEFAAGEVSPGIWMFCTPARETERYFISRIVAYAFGVSGTFVLVHGLDHSPKYVVLGSMLVALAIFWKRYAKARYAGSEA